MGPQNYEIGVSEVHCTGNEKSLTSCEHNEVNPSCPSGSYAAVVCSTYEGPFQGMVFYEGKQIVLDIIPFVVMSWVTVLEVFGGNGYICREATILSVMFLPPLPKGMLLKRPFWGERELSYAILSNLTIHTTYSQNVTI